MNPTHENEPRAHTTTTTRGSERDYRDYRDRDDDRDRDDYGTHRSRSSAEIEREIERTRTRIEARAHVLEERFSPGQLFDQAWDRVRGGGANDFVANLGRDIRDNPLPLLLTGVGIAWLMRGEERRRYTELDVDYDNLDPIRYGEDDRSSAADKARRAARRTKEGAQRLKERASRMGSSVSSAARAGRDRLSEASHGLGDGMDKLRSGWFRMVDEQPILLGLFGLAAGAAIAASLPSTETEDELMGDASENLKERAARKGREFAGEARHFAEEKLSDGDGDARRKSPSGGAAPSGSAAGSSKNPGQSTSGAFGSQISEPRVSGGTGAPGQSQGNRPGAGGPGLPDRR